VFVARDDYALNDNGLTFIANISERHEGEVRLLEWHSGRSRVLAAAGPWALSRGAGVSVSPDGKWIVFPKTQLESDLVLVEHFR
jgi:hypothetical protein